MAEDLCSLFSIDVGFGIQTPLVKFYIGLRGRETYVEALKCASPHYMDLLGSSHKAIHPVRCVNTVSTGNLLFLGDSVRPIYSLVMKEAPDMSDHNLLIFVSQVIVQRQPYETLAFLHRILVLPREPP